ncbi:hypothetical protein LWI28_012956 [Acer negundo]|uniref:Uncharacterized protein n=1 Tax=Acer negundo TaxID=4023 RepID=A0AAD5IAJ2_ACENE|nr:hypothetical protein LWI28_012956 [Acer negundo]
MEIRKKRRRRRRRPADRPAAAAIGEGRKKKKERRKKEDEDDRPVGASRSAIDEGRKKMRPHNMIDCRVEFFQFIPPPPSWRCAAGGGGVTVTGLASLAQATTHLMFSSPQAPMQTNGLSCAGLDEHSVAQVTTSSSHLVRHCCSDFCWPCIRTATTHISRTTVTTCAVDSDGPRNFN